MRLRPASLVMFAAVLNVLALAAAGQPALSEITGPASTTCAESPSVTIRLTALAPSGGLAIQLASSVPTVIALPSSSVTVPQGEAAVTFHPSCFPKSTNNPVTLTATAGGVSRSTVINVLAPVLQSIALGAQSSSSARSATVTLAAPAVQAFNVTLLSSNPAAASVPPGVTIPAGQSAATFTVTTFPAAQPASATISAILGTVTRTATISVPGSTITDGTSNTIAFPETPPVPASVTFQSGLSFVSSKTITGGQTQQAKVTLDRAAGGLGVTVSLSSSNPSAATVPASVAVAAGQNAATFNVTTIAVAQTATATISATAGTVTRGATLTVAPPTTSITDGTSNTIGFTEQPPAVPASVTFQSGLSFVSSKTIAGGQVQQAKVTLDRVAGTAGVAVALRSSNTAATVPASVTVAAGQNAATFNVSTIAVAQTATATISATVGTVTRSATLTVSPPTTSITDGTSNTIGLTGALTFSVSPQQVQGGSPMTGQISAPASSTELVVKLSAIDSTVTFPRSITFGAGETTRSFAIATSPVALPKQVTITAVLDQGASSLTSSRQLTVLPPQLAGLTLSHEGAPANTTVTGKVALTGPAPPDLPITVAVSDVSAAKVTSKVEFAPGSSSGAFSLVTAQVKSETAVKVTVTLGTASMSALLRVTP